MKTWIKRALAFSLTALGAVALSSGYAEAGTTAAMPFTLSATVTAACTASMPNTAITFPNAYVSGSGSTDTAGGIDVDIICPGTNAGAPANTTLTFTPTVANNSLGFELSNATAGSCGNVNPAANCLSYRICDQSNGLGCAGNGIYTAGVQNTLNVIPVNTNLAATSYKFQAVISANQSPPAEATAYTQSVSLVVNY
jgi:hypothetical protein